MRSAECGMHTEFSQEATERTEERELLNIEHRVEQKVTKARKGRIEQEATERTEEELHGLHGLHRYMGCQAQTPWWIQQKGIPMNRIGMSLTPRTITEKGRELLNFE